jgi:hypothetical protein
MAAIPLVDVSQDEATAAAQVFQACTQSGFFYGACVGAQQSVCCSYTHTRWC